MGFVSTLIERDGKHANPSLPQGLQELYGGDLHFPAAPDNRPYVIGNFVSTLDGVVSYKIKGHSGGSTISDSDLGDRFTMGLLRASVDAVMVGSRTVHEVSSKHLWIPEYVYPEAKALFADYRTGVLRKQQNPLVVIVSGSGRLELGRAIFQTPEVRAIVITTSAGREELVKAGVTQLRSVDIQAIDSKSGNIDPQAILHLLQSQFGIRTILHEGGPSLFGQFLAAEMVDELFLTLAPQIAGRSVRTARPGIVEGVEFQPGTSPWFQLVAVKQRGEHLYMRYRRTGPHPSVA